MKTTTTFHDQPSPHISMRDWVLCVLSERARAHTPAPDYIAEHLEHQSRRHVVDQALTVFVEDLRATAELPIIEEE